MSTPQEKAKELVAAYARIDGYVDSIDLSKCEFEKKCALITVDEVWRQLEAARVFEDYDYWQEVKQEIEKI
jgi:hypothetical protein